MFITDVEVFIDTYHPVTELGDYMSHHEAQELIRRRGGSDKNLWTVVEGDYGMLFIEQGFHYVNRLGYIVTAAPYDGHDVTRSFIWSMGDAVIIRSTHGDVLAEWETGEVISVYPSEWAESDLEGIAKFNVNEWRERYGDDDNPELIDIADIGYHETINGRMQYIKPNNDWRELKARGFDL